MNHDELKRMAKRMRLMSLKMAYNAGKSGAHLGGAMSAMEIMAVLYGSVIKTVKGRERDRVLLGKAHCVLAYYSALFEIGLLLPEDIEGFEQNGHILTGHPRRNPGKGIEYSGGSLGMAISTAVGMSIKLKFDNNPGRVFVLLGDGECQEGSVWESLMVADHYKLDNLILIVDQNGLQSDGKVIEVAGETRYSEKFKSFGCDVEEIDGHSIAALTEAFSHKPADCPKVIIANTIKGKGISFMENEPSWHHAVLSKAQYEQAIAELEEND